MSDTLQRIGLYLHTLRWLRVSQLFWQFYRRLVPENRPITVAAEPVRSNLLSQPPVRQPQPDSYEFRFLNESRPADPESIDWHPQDQSRLWRYNLHYFDYLLCDSFAGEHKSALIDSWIEANPVGTIDAWEPYTVSLRIVNWVKYFDSLESEIPGHWADSLLNQAVWLEANLEHHVLANHLMKNAKALVFAGATFAGDNGQRLLRKGLELVLRETREQMLADGGHYERSPMYHSIVLEDYLDLINLLAADLRLADATAIDRLTHTARQALQFLDAVLGADGRLPLLNDSAYGIAAEPDELFDYGRRLIDFVRLNNGSRPVRVNLYATGYYGYRHGRDSMLIDCGPVGPDYQPGHAHCDALSYVLCVDGQQLIVDSGVRGYEDDSLRDYVRSTAAHNTVCVAGQEQSEVWGTFRVARRARARLAELTEIENDRLSFVGSHDGYRRLSAGVEHSRQIAVDLNGRWRIRDRLTGEGDADAESFVHFDPDVELTREGDATFTLSRSGGPIATIRIVASDEVALIRGHYCPEFGVAIENIVLVMRVAGALPIEIEYEIAKPGYADIDAKPLT